MNVRKEISYKINEIFEKSRIFAVKITELHEKNTYFPVFRLYGSFFVGSGERDCIQLPPPSRECPRCCSWWRQYYNYR